MSLFLKKFDNHAEYEEARQNLILPNVSYCVSENEVHYNPLVCEESSTYELVGTPSYPSEVEGADTSFDMTFNYKRTDISKKCRETITEGSDTVTVEIGANPSTASSRTVDGTYDYHGLEIAYTITQTKFEAKVTAKFNVLSTYNSTQIASGTSNFAAIEIDGVVQPSVVTSYNFSKGEHTVKYTLKDPTSIGDSAFTNCIFITSIDIPSSVTSIGDYAFYSGANLTSINIPSGVTSIGDNTFYHCDSLTSINIPSGVTSIDKHAIRNCSSLTSIEIPSGVTSIGDYAFYADTRLTSVIVNATTPPTLGNSVFGYGASGRKIYVPSESVDSYKAATNWSTYASAIEPIS